MRRILRVEEATLIPSVLALGFVGGSLVPRRGMWVVFGATLVWIILVLVGGSVDSVSGTAGAAAFGAGNAVVGFGLGWFSRKAVERLTRL